MHIESFSAIESDNLVRISNVTRLLSNQIRANVRVTKNSHRLSKLDNGGVLGDFTKLDIFSTKDMPIERIQSLSYCRSKLDNGGVLGDFTKLAIFTTIDMPIEMVKKKRNPQETR